MWALKSFLSFQNSIVVENEKEISTKHISAITESYKFLDKFLQDKNYLTGPSLTVADLCCVATVSTATIITPISTQSIPTCPHGIEPARTFQTTSKATVWVWTNSTLTLNLN